MIDITKEIEDIVNKIVDYTENQEELAWDGLDRNSPDYTDNIFEWLERNKKCSVNEIRKIFDKALTDNNQRVIEIIKAKRAKIDDGDMGGGDYAASVVDDILQELSESEGK